MSFTPYLEFAGQAREALTFYAEVFGGTTQFLSFAEGPAEYALEGKEDWLMHGMVFTDSGAALMASDVPGTMGPPVAMGQIYHEAPDIAAAQKVFDALAMGGKVTMPFEETFWSPGFGSVIDRFGLSWAISVPDPA